MEKQDKITEDKASRALLTAYQEAIEMCSGNKEIRYRRATLLGWLGREREALLEWKAILAMYPGDLLANRGVQELKTKIGRAERAEKSRTSSDQQAY